ncbi:MAG: hypothetical protein COU11_00800 [Candidatus Harrisonbacteria bacterium CG10_big_fil_rev_8_21_14_0_10_49_15]|uniref:Rod shape-determining protein RodA n=1 Tax=Candidatus Harrisonbacteria bacterium CG10_big_fil_rev_8_21_14_0_10_49_15 TaxID=1974587 RepID=A0A2H0ULT4_9BACT|nr:MAG: hypothetical protein COU11_00800 [Candidatus Harrisonbacteria bacterium CG10_big_fil_rev_8_21_14_0_10_49_15]
MLSYFRRQDWLLNGAVFFLIGLGLLQIYSISAGGLFPQQLLWAGLSILLIFVFLYTDWRALISYRWIIVSIYLLAIALLILTYFFAPSIRGIRSWLVVGPLRFQVSEFAKLALIIFFSYYFVRRHISIARLSNIIRPFIYFAIPALLVFLQPDLGTVIVLFGIWVAFLLVSGLRLKHIAIGLVILAIVAGIGWTSVLADYQKERIIGLFQPGYDPLGVNYSTIQSKIAVGSAGLIGKGFGQGTQVQLGFLPESGTDYIFSSVMEEWGLLAGILVLAAFAVMLWRIIIIGLYAESNFYKFFCLGAASMFVLQFTINTGSAVGLLPVIGITFPFLSYGGSSLLINGIIIGIIQSATVHKALS